jgi:glycopeptide antibiotics resistance protein
VLKKLTLAYSLLLVLLAILPINSGDSALNNNYILSLRLDYLVHFAVFIPWVVLVWWATGVSFRSEPLKAFGWIAAGIMLAVFTEAVQYLLSYRSFNINDLVANIIGIVLGSVVFFFRRWS